MHWRSLSASGLVIALIGFFLTRFTVTLAADETTSQFLFAGIVPLVMGLSLTAFGVILTVGSYDPKLVRTTARWCAIGTASMALLVALTLLGAQPDGMMDPAVLREQTYLSNFMIGGAVGGTLTGLYAARNRRHRLELRQQANRLILLNRLLRDQVINAATAIKGHSSLLAEDDSQESIEVIDRQAQAVIDTVEDVKYLSNTADKADLTLGPTDVVACLEGELEAARERYPEATFEWTAPDERIDVRANAQLAEVLGQLLENAVEYSENPQIHLTIETIRSRVMVRVADNGSGLPDAQQQLLKHGEIAEFDDPTTGFGLNIVRLLVESFDGEIETAVDDGGTLITVELPRADSRPDPGRAGSSLTVPGVTPPEAAIAIGAALVAGATMGVAMEATGGGIPIIGALYGIEELAVGIISHEFHSIVFGLLYAGILSAVPAARSQEIHTRIGIALGVSLFLWLVAAGFVMPLWLNLVGLSTPVPLLTAPSLVGHLVWAVTLAVLYHYGTAWLTWTETHDRSYLVGLLERG
ncbi:MAG: HAMP domain-containing sensor histidine kinase [Halovenus sp.]|uniref:ATP-binding protein n=1 Tax=Halovenus amylolytica TaxID=2500550 RepID=UPI002FC570CF